MAWKRIKSWKIIVIPIKGGSGIENIIFDISQKAETKKSFSIIYIKTIFQIDHFPLHSPLSCIFKVHVENTKLVFRPKDNLGFQITLILYS